MDGIVQANAAGAEESASAAQELSAQAGEVQNLVSTLRELVGGNVTATTQATAITDSSDAAANATTTARPTSAHSRSRRDQNGNATSEFGKPPFTAELVTR